MDESEITAKNDRKNRECCPVCLGKNFVPERKIRDHIDHSLFSVVHCHDCSVRFIVDPPSLGTIQNYYTNDAGIRMHKQGSGIHHRLRNLLLRDELKPLTKKLEPGSQIVDYGAGDGSVSKFLHDRGFEISAFDMYPQAEWLYPDIEYQQIDLNIPIPLFRIPGNEKITRAVVLRHTLEHLYEPAKILSIFRDTGVNYVLIVVPNYKSIMRPLLGGNWYYWDPPRHLHYFTERSLYCLAERCGYKLLETTTYAVDEVVTSLHRRMLLKNEETQTNLTRAVTRITDPKSPLAAISSVIASFFGNCIIHALLEKYKQT
ncbi:MAG: class I SAM-dependent methyltransferase [Kiritimatiellae bacterium]|nr:class I SAM-dependent methyltransferase [Kiritimatiellia bacterium]MDD5522612.1 class I SAM-dependent methyltransferase [Kiritimatiellia bacterium]